MSVKFCFDIPSDCWENWKKLSWLLFCHTLYVFRTCNIVNFLISYHFYTATRLSKARYSLLVLKVPLNRNQSIIAVRTVCCRFLWSTAPTTSRSLLSTGSGTKWRRTLTDRWQVTAWMTLCQTRSTNSKWSLLMTSAVRTSSHCSFSALLPTVCCSPYSCTGRPKKY